MRSVRSSTISTCGPSDGSLLLGRLGASRQQISKISSATACPRGGYLALIGARCAICLPRPGSVALGGGGQAGADPKTPPPPPLGGAPAIIWGAWRATPGGPRPP